MVYAKKLLNIHSFLYFYDFLLIILAVMNRILYFVLYFAFSLISLADEGMWMIGEVDSVVLEKMQQRGYAKGINDLYDTNGKSMKDAVVIFGGYCTGEIISPYGLVLTNHHCGFDAIQNHSSIQNNYLRDGFYAESKEKELPNEGLFVEFLVRTEDVTDSILADVDDTLSEDSRRKVIFALIDEMESKYSKEPYIRAEVKSLYNENEYHLFVYKKYTDVRLVCAPPSGIGKFGDETDNWMWPRHTGDFTLFRIYADSLGNPAEYKASNIPYNSNTFFPVSKKGYEKGDYAMVIGFPGSTERFIPERGVRSMAEVVNEIRIKVRTAKLNILREQMQKDEQIQIMYASKFAHSSNYWKYSIGQNKSIKDRKILQEKLAFEEGLNSWLKLDSVRFSKFQDPLNTYSDIVDKRKPFLSSILMMNEAFFMSVEIIDFAASLFDFEQYLEDNDTAAIRKRVIELRLQATDYFKNYSAEIDQMVAEKMLTLYHSSVSPEFHPAIYSKIYKKFKGNHIAYLNKLYSTSVLADSIKFNDFLAKPDYKKLKNDLAFQAALDIYVKYSEIYDQMKKYDLAKNKALRLYVAALKEFDSTLLLYPDANFTMRMTYGSVEPYSPKDAAFYDYYTTVNGIWEKYDSTSTEFNLPLRFLTNITKTKLAEFYYDSVMKINFITTNDITGGNSGSPVINANGELVGCAFDGNWEAMGSDLKYDLGVQRCIAVDVRYILYFIKYYAQMHYLIDEMQIVY